MEFSVYGCNAGCYNDVDLTLLRALELDFDKTHNKIMFIEERYGEFEDSMDKY